MPKSIIIAPERVFSREVIRFSDIPVNAYATSLKEELANYSREDLVSIWLDMCAIREFETILGEIKTKGTYKGVTYTHAGPAHLSIGQEAAAWHGDPARSRGSRLRIAPQPRRDSRQGFFSDQTAERRTTARYHAVVS